MSDTRKLTARGIAFQTRSHYRYQLVDIHNGKVRIWGRTDNLATAHQRVRAEADDSFIIDADTNTEVTR